MKLTCDSCNAKYSIADDRVAGKVFKIRCKKCSHVIIVRGEVPVADVAPPPTTSGEWYAIVDGQQAGPFERTRLGEFSGDTFVWREGMDDWVELATLDEPRAPAPVLPTPTPIDAKTLRNERNETSVLFTLGNLAQLAKPAPAAKPTMTNDGPVEEGSGLIDIRALASSLAPQGVAAAKPASGSFGDLPLYASTSIADPVVLVPTPSRRGIDRRLLVAFAAMLAMIAVLVTMLIIVISRNSGTARAATEPAPTPTAVPVPVPVAIATPAPAPAPEPVVVAPQQTPAPTPPAPPKQTHKQTTPPPPKPRREAEPPPKKADEGDCTDVSCTYNDFAGSCCDRYRPKTPKAGAPQPTAAGDLPENLDRAELAAGIATIKAQRCGSSSSARGDVNVSVKVTPEGKVSSVTIKSTPDQALASCVEREAKLGSFAKTKRGGTFKYFWRF